MSRLVSNMSDTFETSVRWCRSYPMEIGRKIESCIGVYSLTTMAQ